MLFIDPKFEEGCQHSQLMKMISLQWNITTNRNASPIGSFLLRIHLMPELVTIIFPITLLTLNSSVKERLLCWSCTRRLWHRLLLSINWKSVFGFATSHRGHTLWQDKTRWLLNLCQFLFDASTKTSFTGRNSVLNDVKKGELWSPDFMTLPEGIIYKKRLNTSWINN